MSEPKEHPLTIRFTRTQMKNLEEYSKKAGLKKAEIVRRCVEMALSDKAFIVSFKGPFLKELDCYASELMVTKGEAVQIMTIAFMTLMKTPLWNIVKPIDEIVEALVREKYEPEQG